MKDGKPTSFGIYVTSSPTQAAERIIRIYTPCIKFPSAFRAETRFETPTNRQILSRHQQRVISLIKGIVNEQQDMQTREKSRAKQQEQCVNEGIFQDRNATLSGSERGEILSLAARYSRLNKRGRRLEGAYYNSNIRNLVPPQLELNTSPLRPKIINASLISPKIIKDVGRVIHSRNVSLCRYSTCQKDATILASKVRNRFENVQSSTTRRHGTLLYKSIGAQDYTLHAKLMAKCMYSPLILVFSNIQDRTLRSALAINLFRSNKA